MATKKIPKWFWPVMALLISTIFGPILVYYVTREPSPVSILNPTTEVVRERFTVEWVPSHIKCQLKVYQKGSLVWEPKEPKKWYLSGQVTLQLAPSTNKYVLKIIDEYARTMSTEFIVCSPETRPKENKEQIEKEVAHAPLLFIVMQRKSSAEPWQKANTIFSGWLYQIHLKVFEKFYIYGFQKDSSQKLQKIFPVPDPQIPKKYQYCFDNPLSPGEYYLPPKGAGFVLDDVVGREHFYFLYSSSALNKPEQIIKEHLMGKRYSLTVSQSIEHKNEGIKD